MYTGVQTFNKRVGVLRFFFTRITMAPSDSLWHFFDFFHHQGRSKKHEILLCYLFLKKKQLGILSSKPSSQILKQKNSFVFLILFLRLWNLLSGS